VATPPLDLDGGRALLAVHQVPDRIILLVVECYNIQMVNGAHISGGEHRKGHDRAYLPGIPRHRSTYLEYC